MFKRKLPSSRKGGSGKNESGILAARRLLRRRLRIEQLESRQLLAYSIFLDIPGIDGSGSGSGAGPTDMKLDSFKWSMSRASTATPPVVNNLLFEKGVDSATPKLIKDALIGPVYNSSPTVLRVTEDFGENFGVEQLKFELNNTRLTSFAAVDSTTESAALSFSKISFTESLPDPATGKSTSSRTASLNLLDGSRTKSSIFNPNEVVKRQTVLTIDGVDLVIDNYNWDVQRPVGFGATDTPFTFSRPLDKATAGLLGSIMAGTTHSKVTLSDRRGLLEGKNDITQTYMTWDFTNAFITNFEIDVDENGANTLFSLKSSKLDITYNPSPLASLENPEYETPQTVILERNGNNVTTQSVSLPLSKEPAPLVKYISFPTGRVAYDGLTWSINNNISSDSLRNSVPFDSTFGSLQISMPLSSSAPGLIRDVLSGVEHATVKINGDASSDSDDRWNLSEVSVTRYEISSGPGSEPFVNLELSFKKAEVTQFRSEPPATVSANYNQTQNTTTSSLTFGGANDSTADLVMIVTENNVVTEIPVLLTSLDAHNRGITRGTTDAGRGLGTIGQFSITVDRGIYSPGFFLAAATGAKIDNIKVARYLPGKSGQAASLQYQFELEDVFIGSYETNASSDLNSIGEDSISLVPTKLRLKTNTRNLNGTIHSTSNVEINFRTQTVDLPSDDTLGLNNTLPGDRFPQMTFGGRVEVDNFSMSAKSNVSVLTNGKRTPDQPQLEAVQIGSTRNPSAFFLGRLFSGISYPSSDVLKLEGTNAQQDKQSATSDWQLTNRKFATEFLFSDGAGESDADFVMGFIPDNLDIQQKQINNQGQISPGSKVAWNVDKSSATLDNSNLNTFQFPTSSGPETVLQFVSGSKILELDLETLSWSTSNPVVQPVGTVKAPTTLARRQGASQVDFVMLARLDAAAPAFINALANRNEISDLKITQRRTIRADGDDQFLPIREWLLEDSYIEELFTIIEDSNHPGYLELHLNVGKFTSKFFEYDPFSNTPFLSNASARGASSQSTPIIASADPLNQFTDSVDFVTPPVALGIGNFITSSQTTRTISLPTVFSDEQEAANTLTYTFTILDNPGLFDSVSIDTSQNLILDFKNGVSGVARISVSAMDSFGLIGTDIFQVGTDVTLDFGDAPAPYPTLLAPNGAGHVAIGPRLGALRDTEADGQPNANATGDGADEDGVMFGQVIAGQTLAGVNVTLQNATAARVDAWIDFNRDGDFDDEGEKILDSIALIAGLQTLNYNIPAGTTAGNTFARVRVSSAGGLGPNGLAADGEVEDYAVTVRSAATVVNQKIFYNRSFFDGSTFSNGNVVTDGANDAAAIDNTKTPLLPGGTATQANYTNYSRGINGIFIDVQNLPGPITAADFTFRVGNSNTPNSWAIAPAPASITVLPGAGLNGSDRIRITWADNAIQKTWLQVTVKGTSNTGLLSDNIHYWGNAVGDTADSTANSFVNSTDQVRIRNNPRNFTNPALVDSLFDINKDRFVNSTDEILARNNSTNFSTALKLIQV